MGARESQPEPNPPVPMHIPIVETPDGTIHRNDETSAYHFRPKDTQLTASISEFRDASALYVKLGHGHADQNKQLYYVRKQATLDGRNMTDGTGPSE